MALGMTVWLIDMLEVVTKRGRRLRKDEEGAVQTLALPRYTLVNETCTSQDEPSRYCFVPHARTQSHSHVHSADNYGLEYNVCLTLTKSKQVNPEDNARCLHLESYHTYQLNESKPCFNSSSTPKSPTLLL